MLKNVITCFKNFADKCEYKIYPILYGARKFIRAGLIKRNILRKFPRDNEKSLGSTENTVLIIIYKKSQKN